MIPKEPITINSEGSGRPFPMPERPPIEKTTAERNKQIIINLHDLNGDHSPKNFVRRAGRVIGSFANYWTPDEEERDEDDIR